jgi:hypothetical protein
MQQVLLFWIFYFKELFSGTISHFIGGKLVLFLFLKVIFNLRNIRLRN